MIFSLGLIPFFVGLTVCYFLVKFYYLKNVYVLKPQKTITKSSSSEEIDDKLIKVIYTRRESFSSLNKFCSSNSLDDFSEVIDIESDHIEAIQINQNANKSLIQNSDDLFTEDHIPDLNEWLESSKVIKKEENDVPLRNDENLDNRSSKDESNRIAIDDHTISYQNSHKQEPTKYLNLNSEQLNNKQLQILTSLSYLVNEERLSVMICKLKLPIFKNSHQRFPFYRRSNLENENYLKIYQQFELIKQTKYIFVKIYLIDSKTRKRLSKKKSSFMLVDGKNTILNNNPYDLNKYIVINELMIFKLPINQLSNITIRLNVLGLSSLSNLNQIGNLKGKKVKKSIDTLYSFGHIEIGCNSLSKSAFIHYQNLLNNLKKPVCSWHCLDLNKQTKRKSSIS